MLMSSGSFMRLAWGSVPSAYTPKSGEWFPLFTEVSLNGDKVREMLTDNKMTSYRVYFEEDKN